MAFLEIFPILIFQNVNIYFIIYINILIILIKLCNKKDQIINLNNVLEKAIDYSIDFPFLTDEKTINFIKNSKVNILLL